MKTSASYDYIFAGAGAAGLSLLMRIINEPSLQNKSILVIDKTLKNENDRTWCFWEKEKGWFDSIVYHRWDKAWFHGKEFSTLMDIRPYEYKLIRGIDFYKYCLDKINAASNIEWKHGEVSQIEEVNDAVVVHANGDLFTSSFVFSSLLPDNLQRKKIDCHLLQHFKGWKIQTAKPVFNPAEATLMDFRVSQEYGTSFVYIMPFTANEALVEFTIFSASMLKPGDYDRMLRAYIDQLGTGYRILEEEFAFIPMTNRKFKTHQGRIIYIGTAGGQTKASSGYTFQFIQKDAENICRSLVQKNEPLFYRKPTPKRFRFYDDTLLHILYHNQVPGDQIFSTLFRKNKPASILAFLDNESSLREEIGIISTLPTMPFLKAALKQ